MSKCIKCGSYAFNLYKEEIDQGGLCDVHYWQGRAHRAEALAEQPAPMIRGDIRDGLVDDEPAQQQEPVAWRVWCGDAYELFFSKYAADRRADCFTKRPDVEPLHTSPPAQRKPLTDEQIDLLINGRGDEGDADYVEPTGDGFGLTDADLVKLVRRVEAAHGIKENT